MDLIILYMELTPSWICSFFINLPLTFDIMTFKLFRNWKLSSLNPYSSKKPLNILVLIKALCDLGKLRTYKVLSLFICLVLVQNYFFYFSFLLGSSAHINWRRWLGFQYTGSKITQYIFLSVSLTFCILFHLLRLTQIIWEGNGLKREWQMIYLFSVPCVFIFLS